MNSSKLVLTLLAMSTGTACTTVSRSSYAHRPHHGARVTVAALHAELSPYGELVYLPGTGRVWRPYDMPAGWQPYTLGHWVWSNDDWAWESDLTWGWAAFHYGRWTFASQYGWVWIPDETWGPAWVAWSYDTGHVSWAPLPPGAYWTGNGWSVSIASDRWCYVPRSDFRSRHVHRVVKRGRRNAHAVHRSFPAPANARAHASARPAQRRAHEPVITHAPKRRSEPARSASRAAPVRRSDSYAPTTRSRPASSFSPARRPAPVKRLTPSYEPTRRRAPNESYKPAKKASPSKAKSKAKTTKKGRSAR